MVSSLCELETRRKISMRMIDRGMRRNLKTSDSFSTYKYAGLFGTRGYLERGAIWNARLFAHRRLYIFPTFLSFQLIAEKPQPTRSAFGFFQATGSEEVLLDCEFRRDRELLDRPKAFKNAFLHWRISSKIFERFFLACRSKNRRINLE